MVIYNCGPMSDHINEASLYDILTFCHKVPAKMHSYHTNTWSFPLLSSPKFLLYSLKFSRTGFFTGFMVLKHSQKFLLENIVYIL